MKTFHFPIAAWPRTLTRTLTGALAGALIGAVLTIMAPIGLARADTGAGLAAYRSGQFAEAVMEWRQAAEAGDAAAALYLGVLHDTGFGVTQSEPEALQWYRRAGERGNVTGMFNTALMLDAGRGTAADPAAAIEWYRRAAQAGSGRAAYNLGLIYQNGIGVPVDRGAAVRSFRQALANGVAQGRTHLRQLGVREASRVGPSRQDVAMTDFDRAQRALMMRGPEADAVTATLFRKAADGGNALAAYNLAYCYEHGIGVPADNGQAGRWYRQSVALARDPAIRAIAQRGEEKTAASGSAQR